MDYVKMAETMEVPVEKPMDAMNPLDFVKLGMSMKDMGKVMKEYGNMDMEELAMRFRHPLIRRAITDYMPKKYQAYAFLVSYGTVTGGTEIFPRADPGQCPSGLQINTKHTAVLHTPALP